MFKVGDKIKARYNTPAWFMYKRNTLIVNGKRNPYYEDEPGMVYYKDLYGKHNGWKVEYFLLYNAAPSEIECLDSIQNNFKDGI